MILLTVPRKSALPWDDDVCQALMPPEQSIDLFLLRDKKAQSTFLSIDLVQILVIAVIQINELLGPPLGLTQN